MHTSPSSSPVRYDISEVFAEESFVEKWQRVLDGLHCRRDSGEYKYARYQLLRLWAPIAAAVVPALALLIMLLVPARDEGAMPVFTTTRLDSTPKPPEVLTPELPPEPDVKQMPETVVDSHVVTELPINELPDAAPDAGRPDGITIVDPRITFVDRNTSRFIMPGVYVDRIKGLREGPPIGGRPVARPPAGVDTEVAVLRALRWLKQCQGSDGSWTAASGGGPGTQQGACVPAMTGLALLTYLAHGEMPDSKEFGETVERAIRWLLEKQEKDGRFPQRDGNDYSQPIAAYALAEAAGMTGIPAVRDAAEKAVEVLIKGQHASGAWNYNCDAANRDDTSYSGWCVQALKAARIAGLGNPGLNPALQKAVAGFRRNFKNGLFTYTTDSDPGGGHLTSVGVLSMQLLGAGRQAEARAGMSWLNQNATCDWKQPWGRNPIYYWYYLTQAKFHEGDAVWNEWNRQFAVQFTRNQSVMPGAGADGVDIGYWEGLDEHCKARVYNTTLCTLSLEVYYKVLPSFVQGDTPVVEEDTGGSSSVKVEIRG